MGSPVLGSVSILMRLFGSPVARGSHIGSTCSRDLAFAYWLPTEDAIRPTRISGGGTASGCLVGRHSLTSTRRRAAGVALEAGAVAHHGEVAAFGAGFADIAFHARFGAAFGDLLVCRGGGGGAERQRRRLGEFAFQRGCALDVALRARAAGGLDGRRFAAGAPRAPASACRRGFERRRPLETTETTVAGTPEACSGALS